MQHNTALKMDADSAALRLAPHKLSLEKIMNKYSENFNDIDPESGRPFSAGYPDGVWIISIIYGLIALVSVGMAVSGVYKIISGSNAGYAIFMSAGINAFIFVLALYFLFKRSGNAIYIVGFIACFAVLAGAASFFLETGSKFILSGVACLQIYILSYVMGLKKDGLLA
jgi:hypothetical protein